VRPATIRHGQHKLIGSALYDLEKDPAEREDVAAAHPELVAALQKRLAEVAATRPPLGPLTQLMEPALPDVYGREENAVAPAWLRQHVRNLRAAQPQSYPPGKTPWPQPPRDGKITYTGDGR
ncbi:MAG: Arylsulfatase, partial [Planctomycetota bacterium]